MCKGLWVRRLSRAQYKRLCVYLVGISLCLYICLGVLFTHLESTLGSKFIYRPSSDFITYHGRGSGFTKAPIKIKFMTPYLGSWVTHWKDFELRYAASNCRWKCAYNHSIFPNNGTDSQVLVFHANDLAGHPEYLPSKRTTEQIWLLLNSEGPWLTRLDMKRYNNVFNWTSFVRNDSDVSFHHATIRRRNNDTALPEQRLKKKHAYWMVSNCFATNHRDAYVDELKRHIPIDVFSQLNCYPDAQMCHIWARECDRLAYDYNFYLAFENANCRDYITEKLWRGLVSGVIPIVMGDSEGYKKVAPPGSYIDVADFPSPDKLAKYLLKVEKDLSLYQSYFLWRKQYEIVDKWACDLCRELHFWTGTHQVYNDLSGWNEQDSCSSWNAVGHVYLYTSSYWRIAKRWALWILGMTS